LSSATWLGELYRPTRHARALARLAAADRRRHRRDDAEPSLAALAINADAVGRDLARDLEAGAYRPTPARIRRARLDKERALLVLAPIDRVVHAVLGELLGDAIEPLLSDQLYSYRTGRSAQLALRALGAYLRAHRAARPDPRDRGLYVLRADVAAYGDSIRLDDRAPIWPMLEQLVGGRAPADGSPHAAAWRALVGAVRPPIAGDGESWAARGLPTGSPIVAPLANLYHGEVDRALEAVPGGLYLRYGDDILFAHPDPGRVGDAIGRAEAILDRLGLALHPGKRQLLYLTGAGRPDPRGQARGADRIAYLGCDTSFAGTVSLPARKAGELLADVKARVRRSARLIDDAPAGERARTLAAMIARGFDASTPGAVRYAELVCDLVDDRSQLRDLDYRIALTVAEVLSGRRGPRAFRDVSYKSLRRAGLPSLVVRRNRGDRR
jgi:hypothetical protein